MSMPDFGACEEVLTISKIPVQEPHCKCSMMFENPGRRRVRKIRVDDCAIKDGVRCDWLVIAQDGKEHFIELKGRDVRHAIEQLKASIPKLSADPKNSPKCSYIICTRCPLSGTDIQNYQKRFLKAFKSRLDVKTLCWEVVI